jgi:hypothetical protein
MMNWVQEVSGHSPYDVLKDFQPIIAALVALLAASLAYRGAMAKVKFDERLQEGKRLGLYLRLRSQLAALSFTISSVMENHDEIPKGRPMERRRGAVDIDVHRFDEVEDAWKQIDQFPSECVIPLDQVRWRLKELADLAKEESPDGIISSSQTNKFWYSIQVIRDENKALMENLEKAIKRIKPVA